MSSNDADYYPEPDFNALLRAYRQAPNLEASYFLFPVSGLRFLDKMTEIADKGLLILSADKGVSKRQQLIGRGKPHVARHSSDCFLLSVDYYLIGQFVTNKRGRSWLPQQRHNSLCVAGFLLNMPSARETERAFDDAISRFGPDDFFIVKKAMERNFPNMGVSEILVYIRFSAYKFFS